MTPTTRVSVHRWAGTSPEADPGRCLVVLPGRRFPVELAPLSSPMRALALSGWTVVHARWELDDASPAQQRAAVAEAVAALDEMSRGARRRVLLAKSLGTLAAGWAADHAVPAVWLTPLLTHPECAGGLARATAPCLLVAGTDDPTWDDGVAQRLAHPALRVEGADHALQTGDWRAELEIVRHVTDAVERFAREATAAGPAPHRH